jgi:hypothetical protein
VILKSPIQRTFAKIFYEDAESIGILWRARIDARRRAWPTRGLAAINTAEKYFLL